jgi:AraC-like DNA-binding protein
MDALAGFLDGPRAQGAFVLRSILDPPWSLRIQDEAPLTVVAVMRGDAWYVPDRGEPVRLAPGDVAIVRGPDPYTFADDPATDPQVVIHPGQVCTTIDGESLHEAMDLGVRTWGTDPAGSVVMLTGTYHTDGEVSRRLLDALPAIVVLRNDSWDCPVLPLLATEVVKDEPGQQVVLDRLLDLLVVAALRAAFSRADAEVPAWWRAYGDPIVGRALRMMHRDPGHPWTVAELAAGSGASRAALARRFHELVGEPPMAFLTGWRMALAADLVLEPGASVGAVSRRVGYGSPFTFSTAFKRTYGLSPRDYRDRTLLGTDPGAGAAPGLAVASMPARQVAADSPGPR